MSKQRICEIINVDIDEHFIFRDKEYFVNCAGRVVFAGAGGGLMDSATLMDMLHLSDEDLAGEIAHLVDEDSVGWTQPEIKQAKAVKRLFDKPGCNDIALRRCNSRFIDVECESPEQFYLPWFNFMSLGTGDEVFLNSILDKVTKATLDGNV